MRKDRHRQLRRAEYFVASIAMAVQAGTISGGQASTSPSLAITHVTVIDTANGSVHPAMTVLIGGNRILEVGKSEAVTPPSGITVVDGRGKYLLPGLWDMHVHLFNNRDQVGTNNSEYFFPLLIANGVLGVRDMWTDPEDIEVARRWNDDIEAGSLVGPRVTVSSRVVDGEPPSHPNSLVVHTPDEGRDAVRSLKETGAGFIKVYWSLSRDTYFAIVDESRRQNIPFEGHVPRSVTPGEASDAGQRTIEHMDGLNGACTTVEDRSRYDAGRCEALADRLRKNGTWLVPTAVNFFDPSGVDLDRHRRYAPRQQGAWVRREPSDVGVLVHRAMRQVSHRFLAGTDISIRRPRTVPGFSLHDELALFVERGHTAAEALQAATVNAAMYLDRLDEFGTIETNKRADLLLLDADPLAAIHNTSRIRAVVLNGRLHDREELDRLLARAESIAKTLSVPPEANMTFVITSRGSDPGFAGMWEALLPNLPQALVLEVEVRTTGLTGTLRAGGAKTVQTFEGTVKGNKVTFSLMSPDGDRTVTLTGDLGGDEILFTREVAVRPGGAPGGQGFFGVRGPNSFTARRTP